MTETHPFLKHLEDRLGTDDPQLLNDSAVGLFCTYPVNDRIDIIEKTDAGLSADDGVSLRRKAQLLDFSRKLKAANNALRRAGR